MSFASEVKKEILTITENKKEQIAFTFGALQGLSSIVLSSSGIKLQIKSPVLNIIKKIVPLLKEQFNIKTQDVTIIMRLQNMQWKLSSFIN